MLGHAGGRSLGRLVLAAVQVKIKMLVSVGLVALLERQKKYLNLFDSWLFL
jgi:hypothetical protein